MTPRQKQIVEFLSDGKIATLSQIIGALPECSAYKDPSNRIGFTLAGMVHSGKISRVKHAHYKKREDFDPEHVEIQSHAHRKRCSNLRERTKAYMKIHPVTYRGIARIAGADGYRISTFYSLSRATLPIEDLKKVENFLTERGF